MRLLAVERIKLFSTRSPYWCLAVVLAAALLFAILMGTLQNGENASVFTSQSGLGLGMSVFMVLATLAVTTEYRFGTIRTSFQAVPRRANVLLAKTGLLVVLAAVTATVSSFAAFFLVKALAHSPAEPLTLATGGDWRAVLGHAALFPIAAVIALAVGVLVRQSAGAITIVLVWPLLIESLVRLIPKVGSDISNWMPFNAGSKFVTYISSGGLPQEALSQVLSGGPTPLEGLAVFAGTAVALWIVALLVLQRRDA
ncbi:MAG: hypothetical protein BGO26_19255 [Actinobacteria bacterium 69-20]|jgi:ABC-2 type transport system permease protein|nr:hypothetical protein [Actinomycetota bacterium]OJV24692.1 MAG: hypothetical protein BGO26_19255 [Actinobacteria bacterium 69-20]